MVRTWSCFVFKHIKQYPLISENVRIVNEYKSGSGEFRGKLVGEYHLHDVYYHIIPYYYIRGVNHHLKRYAKFLSKTVGFP